MKDFAAWGRNFADLDSLIAYLFIGLLAFAAGTVSFAFRIQNEDAIFTWRAYFFNVTSSVLVSIVAFWLTLYKGVPPLLSAAAIAIVAFLGTNILVYGMQLFRVRAKRFIKDYGGEAPPTELPKRSIERSEK